MALTREQRKRIEREKQLKMEEEEYRAEVRKNARTEAEEKAGVLSLPARLLLVLIVFGIAYLISLVRSGEPDAPSQKGIAMLRIYLTALGDLCTLCWLSVAPPVGLGIPGLVRYNHKRSLAGHQTGGRIGTMAAGVGLSPCTVSRRCRRNAAHRGAKTVVGDSTQVFLLSTAFLFQSIY